MYIVFFHYKRANAINIKSTQESVKKKKKTNSQIEKWAQSINRQFTEK